MKKTKHLKYFYLSILLLALNTFTFGQDTTNTKGQKDLSISYLGNHLINPGLYVSWEQSLRSRIKTKKGVNKSTKLEYVKFKNREFTQQLNAGFIFAPKTQGIFITGYNIAYRKTGYSGWRWRFAIGANIVQSILPTTYKAEEGSPIVKSFPTGHTYFAPEFSFGFGRKLKDTNKLFSATHCNFKTLFLTNYNNTVQPMINVELGFTLKNIRK